MLFEMGIPGLNQKGLMENGHLTSQLGTDITC
jgi:hypothetical protein